jgi:putative ATPase
LPIGFDRRRLADVTGQDHLTGEDGVLQADDRERLVGIDDLLGTARHRQDHGCAAAIGRGGAAFEQISAIFSGVADLKKVFEGARLRRMDGPDAALSSTRSIASTAHSRIASCLSWKTAP